MDVLDILRLRLRSQLIEGPGAAGPRDAVRRLLAVQAQDYAGSLWAVGLRTSGADAGTVEQAIAEGTIVRTWPMRGTLHLVAAEDVRWMLHLLAARTSSRFESRRRDLGVQERHLVQARKLLASALEGGRSLSRPEAIELLESGGVPTAGQAGYHVLVQLSRDGLLVQGPMRGKRQTFVLLDEWVARTPQSDAAENRSREESLAVLAERYFAGHGPATVADLARWASITKRDATAATTAVAEKLAHAEVDGERYWFEAADAAGAAAPSDAAGAAGAVGSPSVRLLPGFDEYMLGYVGRAHQLGPYLAEYGSRVASNGMLAPTIVIDGAAVGIWKRQIRARTITFTITPFRPFTPAEKTALAREQERYAAFLGRAVG